MDFNGGSSEQTAQEQVAAQGEQGSNCRHSFWRPHGRLSEHVKSGIRRPSPHSRKGVRREKQQQRVLVNAAWCTLFLCMQKRPHSVTSRVTVMRFQ